PDFLEELNRRRVAAVLTADAELQVGARAAPLLHRDLDELADASDVNRRERILLDDLELLIVRQERARVVARHAQTGLREIVRAETEELRRLRDLVSGQCAARDL